MRLGSGPCSFRQSIRFVFCRTLRLCYDVHRLRRTHAIFIHHNSLFRTTTGEVYHVELIEANVEEREE